MTDRPKSDVDRMLEDLEQLRRLSARAPTDPDTRLAFARKLLDSRKPEEAVLEIRAVIALVPNHLAAWKLLESVRELQLSGRISI